MRLPPPRRVLVLGLALGLISGASPPAAAQVLQWSRVGPSPTTQGQTEGIEDDEVVGAVNVVAPHPDRTKPNVLYVGTVNGGVWRTENATDARPSWVQLTDDQRSLSVGALAFDPTDATHATLVAGAGRFSSLSRDGGARSGLIRSTDGGKTWTAINGGDNAMIGLNVCAVAPRGAVLVVAASSADDNARRGLWRSTDTGGSWSRLATVAGSGLPSGLTFDLAGSPAAPAVLYADLRTSSPATAGIYRSENTGQSWSRVSTAAMNDLLANAGNVEIAVGSARNVFVAIVSNTTGQLADVFRSGDDGATWNSMGVPTVGGASIHPGKQGRIHLSLAADPTNATIVYLGGDRQDGRFLVDGSVTNSIGARDYSGCLVRGDSSLPAAARWVHLTHSRTMGPAGGGTRNGSAPHADSRDMAFTADGDTLVEGDDGGVYFRTTPRSNEGDWFSKNGDLQNTEFHSVAWDARSHAVVGGAQDTGSPRQPNQAHVRWTSALTGDGGVVVVDDTSTPGFSIRYLSPQELGQNPSTGQFTGFCRDLYRDTGAFSSRTRPPLTVVGGGAAIQPQFYTPIALNAVDPARLVIGAANSVYESTTQGDSVREIARGVRVNTGGGLPLAYGAAGNADVLYVGTGAEVRVRTGPRPAPLATAPSYPGTRDVMDLVIDPDRPATAFVADTNQVFRTTDSGATWDDLTGNLAALAPGRLRSITFVRRAGVDDRLVVGGDTGVVSSVAPDFTTWGRLGTGFPRAPVMHLEYDRVDDLILAGTLGRGAWTLAFAAASPPAAGLAAAAAPAPAPAPDEDPEEPPAVAPVPLGPGVLIDPARKRAFVERPGGGVASIDLDRGNETWTSAQPLQVLGLAQDALIGMARTPDAVEPFALAQLDPATGDQKFSAPLELPAQVKTAARSSEFQMVAGLRSAGDETILDWEMVERRPRALPPGTDDPLPADEDAGAAPAAPSGLAPASQSAKLRGGFRLNLGERRLTPLDAGDAADVPAPAGLRAATPEIEPEDEVPGAKGEPFVSADGRHLLFSQGTGPITEWDRYTITVYDRATRNRVGSYRSHLAIVPCVVIGSRIVFVTSPFTREVDGKPISQPAQLRAVDLEAGREAWNRPIAAPGHLEATPP